MNGEVDLDEVLGAFSIVGTEWKLHKGVPISFKANAMDNDYKVWYHFLVVKMLPMNHLSIVTKGLNDPLVYNYDWEIY